MKKIQVLKTLLFLLPVICACNKENEWLETKTDKALVVPTTLKDFQALLNNEDIINLRDPSIGSVLAEDYYVPYAAWQSRPNASERNSYIMAAYPYEGENINDWNYPYTQVYYANLVLEGLDKIVPAERGTQWSQLRGQALFVRAWAFYNLVQTFTLPYNVTTASTDLGIPLRLASDLNAPSVRATVQESFDRILTDLKEAVSLLPDQAVVRTRPSRAAAAGMLARVYLIMRNYDQALSYADQCLAISPGLLDYNSLTATAARPIPLFNTEDLYHTRPIAYGILLVTRAFVDTFLYRSYATNDLRRTVLFSGTGNTIAFKGSYDASSSYYGGLATDEVYLIRAECHAAKGNVPAALADLNTLLVKRWRTGTFTPVTATNALSAWQRILEERRKELLFRGIRWTDLRRLSLDSRFAVTLSRTNNSLTYTLPPGDPRYAFLIPDNEMEFSGLIQNPR